MIYLEKLIILEDYNNIPKDLVIELKSINPIVGEQGCGKSSLLDILSNNEKDLITYKSSPLLKKGDVVNSFYFDTEKMNPRIKDPQLYTNPTGKDVGIGFKSSLISRYKSHGEVLREFTVNALHKAVNSVVMLDEPEASLSLANQFKLAKEIKKASSTNQILFSTHSLVLIQSFEEVYDLENKCWVKSIDYINRFK